MKMQIFFVLIAGFLSGCNCCGSRSCGSSTCKYDTSHSTAVQPDTQAVKAADYRVPQQQQ
jgi:hypothetical protein